MTRSEFIKRLKQILSGIKRNPNDSPEDEIVSFFLNRVLQKANGKWDDEIAIQVMKEIEWAFDIQPLDVRKASLVKENDVLKSLKSFLKVRNYELKLIETTRSKTPEGFIKGYDKEYLCEVKSPLLKFDRKASPFGYKFKTNHRKILDFIHTAKKQFDAQDPEHLLPHILIYTSAHFQLCWKDFFDAIKGGVVNLYNGEMMTNFKKTPVYQSTKDLLFQIDGFIWLQVNESKEFYQASYFLNSKSIYKSNTEELFANLHKIKISNMDNFIIIE